MPGEEAKDQRPSTKSNDDQRVRSEGSRSLSQATAPPPQSSPPPPAFRERSTRQAYRNSRTSVEREMSPSPSSRGSIPAIPEEAVLDTMDEDDDDRHGEQRPVVQTFSSSSTTASSNDDVDGYPRHDMSASTSSHNSAGDSRPSFESTPMTATSTYGWTPTSSLRSSRGGSTVQTPSLYESAPPPPPHIITNNLHSS